MSMGECENICAPCATECQIFLCYTLNKIKNGGGNVNMKKYLSILCNVL